MKKYVLLLLANIFILYNLAIAQETSLNCKYSRVGPIGILVTNTGENSWHQVAGKCEGGINNEYPLGSRITYGNWGLWVGARREGKIGVTTAAPSGNPNVNNEFYPSAEPWDTVYVVETGEILDLPYMPNYQGISHQDIICRYNDYNIQSPPVKPNTEPHSPLYIDVIQVLHVFTGFPVLVYRYWVIPQNGKLTRVYIGWAGNAAINEITIPGNDEFGDYDPEYHLGFEKDIYVRNRPEDVGDVGGTVAFRIFPQDSDVPEDSLNWGWDDGLMGDQFPDGDRNKYNIMKGGIRHDELQTTLYGHFSYSVGPFSVEQGDTLKFTIAQINGEDIEDIYDNYFDLLRIQKNNYIVPGPPPRPPLRANVGNHEVQLRWDPESGDIDPESYTDKARLDNEPEPFEGYRIYKSTESAAGPWILLADHDRDDDEWGNNIGLVRSFTDKGLLNNFNYYYTVTSYSKPDTVLDTPPLESSLSGNSISARPGTEAPETVGKVIVVPNPYRGDAKYYATKPAWEQGSSRYGVWTEENRRIQFVNLPNHSKVTIYSVSGKYVADFVHEVEVKEGELESGVRDWNLTSNAGQAVASGIYLFTVEDLETGRIQTGKFVVIK